MLNPIAFIRQVRAEASKVTWPTRREANLTLIMVAIFVSIATVFFLLVDFLISSGVKFIISR